MDGAKLLKQLEAFKDEAHNLRLENRHLRLDFNAARLWGYQCQQEINVLKEQLETVTRERDVLRQRVDDLTSELRHKPVDPPPSPPDFVKANVPRKRRKKPGRPEGHAAALRPMPETIDHYQPVPVPVDASGACSCPDCRTPLSDVKHHERIVEDFTSAQIHTTCYQTVSGYCPRCRKRFESRDRNQPPAANLPHAQLGINALTTAAMMRVCYRMPMRQICDLFARLPGLAISPGAIVKIIKRLSVWLKQPYHRLKLALRAAGFVHADETGWRIDGKNSQLWTLTNDQHTLYHMDRSRGAQVIIDLLGEAFGKQGGGILIRDFYAVYDKISGEQQKCLAHLLRELRDTVTKRPALQTHPFFTQCKRLFKDMIQLKASRDALEPQVYDRRVKRIERRLSELGKAQWGDADADRLAKRLAKYQKKLTTFLHHADVDATNNAAERALRPAVIMRKITGGSRSEQGAEAWSVLASIIRTSQQQGRDVYETIKSLIRSAWAGEQLNLLAVGPGR